MPYKDKKKAMANAAKWATENRERKRAINARSRAKNKDKYNATNNARLKRKRLLMTPEERKIEWKNRWHAAWDRKFGFAKGTHRKLFENATECALCGNPFGLDDGKDTDHNHLTGEFRGILHHSCNVAVGLFRDSEENCLKAAAYLRGAICHAHSQIRVESPCNTVPALQ